MDHLYNIWDGISLLAVTLLAVVGLMLGIVFAVLMASILIGWRLAPWIVAGAFIIWAVGGLV